MGKHEIIKARREIVRRKLQVSTKEELTPRMLRIVFVSEELQGFDSPSADDHIKIFLPTRTDEKPVMRDFTPRAWDLEAGTLTIDFALHEHGPAAEWARSAKVGDSLEIGGPRGSSIVPDDFDWYLLAGDAAALPSMARRLEALRVGVPVYVFVLIPDVEEQYAFSSVAECHVRWLMGSAVPGEDASTLRAALEEIQLPTGDGYAWIAAEASVARETYSYLVEERGHPKVWVKAAAYWTAAREDSGAQSQAGLAKGV